MAFNQKRKCRREVTKSDKDGIHFGTFAAVEWIGVLAIKQYREIVLESLRATQDSMGIIASLRDKNRNDSGF